MTIPVFPYESPCASADPELWFSDDAEDQLTAVSICQACPVIDACRDYTDQIEGRKSIWSMHGIYAAETPRQRKARRAPHGTPSGYSHYGCRCQLCWQAQDQYRKEAVA